MRAKRCVDEPVLDCVEKNGLCELAFVIFPVLHPVYPTPFAVNRSESQKGFVWFLPHTRSIELHGLFPTAALRPREGWEVA